MKKIILIMLIIAVCFSFFACDSDKEAGSVGTSGTSVGATKEPYADEPAGTAYLAKVGTTPVYEYYFTALLSSYVTEALEKEWGYDEEAEAQEAYDFMVSFLNKTNSEGKTNLQIIADKTVDECRRMVTLKLEGNKQGTSLSNANRNSIVSKWDTAADDYLEKYKEIYSSVQTRDDAFRLLYHMNVNEVKEFLFIQSEVTDYINNWYTNGIRPKNSELEEYYKAHVNDFRIVNMRVIYIAKTDENGADQKSLAETVARQIKNKPEYMENLVKGYNQNESFAATSGKIAVTGRVTEVPDEVKAWAFAQTEDTLFEKNGNVEVVESERGYYVVLCESIKEYVDDYENTIYANVGEAYKEEKLNEYIDELEKKEEYAWTEFAEARVMELAQKWVSDAKPPEETTNE